MVRLSSSPFCALINLRRLRKYANITSIAAIPNGERTIVTALRAEVKPRFKMLLLENNTCSPKFHHLPPLQAALAGGRGLSGTDFSGSTTLESEAANE